MYPQSLFLDTLLSKRKEFLEIQKKKIKKEVNEKDRELFDLFKTLIKINKYTQAQPVQVASELYLAMKDAAKISNCKKVFAGTFDRTFKNLVRTEVYFQKRFQGKTFLISEQELKNAMKTMPGLSKEEVRKKEENKRKESAIDLFISSVKKQVAHEDFY